MDTGKAIGEFERGVNTSRVDVPLIPSASRADTRVFKDQLLQESSSDIDSNAVEQELDSFSERGKVASFSTGDMMSEMMKQQDGARSLFDAEINADNPDEMLVGVDNDFGNEEVGRSSQSTLYSDMGEFGTDAILEEKAADAGKAAEKDAPSNVSENPIELDADALDVDLKPEQMVDSSNGAAEIDNQESVEECDVEECDVEECDVEERDVEERDVEERDVEERDEEESDEDTSDDGGDDAECEVEKERELEAYDGPIGYGGERHGSDERGDGRRDSSEEDEDEKDDDEEDRLSVAEFGGELIVDSMGVGFGGMPELFGVDPKTPEVFKDILMRLEGESKQLSGLTLAQAIYEVGGSVSHTEVYIDPSASVETATITEWTPTAEGSMSPLQEKLIGLADTYGDNSTVGEMFDQRLLSNEDIIALHSELRTQRLGA